MNIAYNFLCFLSVFYFLNMNVSFSEAADDSEHLKRLKYCFALAKKYQHHGDPDHETCRLIYCRFKDKYFEREDRFDDGVKEIYELKCLDLSLKSISGLQGSWARAPMVNKINNDGLFKNFDYLEELNLQYNKIQVLDGILQLTRLRKLNLEGNCLRDVGGLCKLQYLQELNLANNYVWNPFRKEYTITLIAPLKKLNFLSKLKLNENKKIEDWHCLYGMTSYENGILKHLDLQNCFEAQKHGVLCNYNGILEKGNSRLKDFFESLSGLENMESYRQEVDEENKKENLEQLGLYSYTWKAYLQIKEDPKRISFSKLEKSMKKTQHVFEISPCYTIRKLYCEKGCKDWVCQFPLEKALENVAEKGVSSLKLWDCFGNYLSDIEKRIVQGEPVLLLGLQDIDGQQLEASSEALKNLRDLSNACVHEDRMIRIEEAVATLAKGQREQHLKLKELQKGILWASSRSTLLDTIGAFVPFLGLGASLLGIASSLNLYHGIAEVLGVCEEAVKPYVNGAWGVFLARRDNILAYVDLHPNARLEAWNLESPYVLSLDSIQPEVFEKCLTYFPLDLREREKNLKEDTQNLLVSKESLPHVTGCVMPEDSQKPSPMDIDGEAPVGEKEFVAPGIVSPASCSRENFSPQKNYDFGKSSSQPALDIYYQNQKEKTCRAKGKRPLRERDRGVKKLKKE